jgi:hypothetical protein
MGDPRLRLSPARTSGRPVEFCGLRLAHPIVNASGTFDAIAARRAFGDALLHDFPFSAFVSKTVTLAPREGNPPPRLWELGAGMINSIGLPNKGLDGYLAHDLPELAVLPVPLIVNVMGSSAEDVATLVRAFGEREEVAALELNVSCPNVRTGLLMGADPGETAALLDAVRPHTAKPLIVKLTPNCTSPADVAAAAEGRPAVARWRHRRRVRPGGARRGSRAGARGPRADRAADRRHGRRPERASCTRPARRGRRPRRGGHGDLPRSRRGRAYRRGARKLRGSGASRGTRARAHSTRRLKNACKTSRYRRVPSTRVKVKSRSS